MDEYTTNPLTGRRIQVNGTTFNRLFVEGYDYINGRLVRRQNAPPIETHDRFHNVETGRIIQHGSRTYHSLIRRGYDIVYSMDGCNDAFIVSADLVREALWELLEPYPDMSLDNLRERQEIAFIRIDLRYRLLYARSEFTARQITENKIAEIEAEIEAEIDLLNAREASRKATAVIRGRPATERRRRIADEEAVRAGMRDAELLGMGDIDLAQEDRPLTQLARERIMDRLTELNIALCKDCQMPYSPSELINELCMECSE